jgi:hypothetical protein
VAAPPVERRHGHRARPPPEVVTVTAPAPAPPRAGPLTTVGDGVWEVGVDVAAGKYKTAGTDSYGCYYARLKNNDGDARRHHQQRFGSFFVGQGPVSHGDDHRPPTGDFERPGAWTGTRAGMSGLKQRPSALPDYGRGWNESGRHRGPRARD